MKRAATNMFEDISGRTAECIEIVFDEGELLAEVPPLFGFGLAVLDDINVNGTRVGRAP